MNKNDVRGEINSQAKTWFRLSVIAITVATMSCSLLGNLSQSSQAGTEDAQDADSTEAPSGSPAIPLGTTGPSLFGDLPPGSLVDILNEGIDQGLWTEGEGLALFINFLLGEEDSSAIPQFERVEFPEATGLLHRAAAYIEQNPEAPDAGRVRRLLRMLLPPKDNLLHYSRPVEQQPSDRPPGDPAPPPLQVGELNCRSLWLQGFPRTDPEDDRDLACLRVASEVVDGVHFSAFYPAEYQDQHRFYAEFAIEALIDSKAEYSKYGEVEDITVLFYPWNAGPRAAIFPDTDELSYESCPLFIFPRLLNEAYELGYEHFKWVVAHEAFHCFQRTNLGLDHNSYSSTASWWAEGSAVYFSNVVYPSAPKKHMFLDDFDEQSNYSFFFDMDYENYVPFQYLANQNGNAWLVGMLDSFPLEGAVASQIPVMAEHMPQDTFHAFGQAFLDQKIRDTGGGFMPIDTEYISELQFSVETSNSYDVSPFVLQRHRLEYTELAHYVQAYSKRTEGRISEQLAVRDGWIEPRDDVRAVCSDPDSILLLTTTEPNEHFTVDFEIPLVDDEAWEMTLSDGTIVSGDHGLYVAGTGPIIVLSQSDSEQSEPLVNLTSGGVYIFETAGGPEYVGNGERVFHEFPSGSLQGEFSARFWVDPAGIVRGDPPDFTGQGAFEACPQQ